MTDAQLCSTWPKISTESGSGKKASPGFYQALMGAGGGGGWVSGFVSVGSGTDRCTKKKKKKGIGIGVMFLI